MRTLQSQLKKKEIPIKFVGYFVRQIYARKEIAVEYFCQHITYYKL